MIRTGSAFVLLSALALAGCGAGRAVGDATGGLFESRQGACPAIGILDDANQVTRFNGMGRDIPDVQYHAEITDVHTSCDYGRAGGQRYAYARVRMNFAAELGSAAHPDVAEIPYFVAVIVRDSNEILVKETYNVRANFDGAHRAVQMHDSIDRIAIPVETVADGGLYEIIVGLEITPDELDYNRRDER